MKLLSKEERSKLSMPAIAEKHGCSKRYVRMVLSGQRECNTEKARAIFDTADSILKVLAEQ